MFSRMLFTTCLALSAPFIACSADKGTDESGGSTKPSTSGGEKQPAANGGAGGADPVLAPAPCGEVTCELPVITIPDVTPIPPCCVDEEAGICGLTAPDGTCTPPPVVDWTCPSANVESVGEMLGCCTNAKCGVDATPLGIGCIELDDPRLLAIYPNSPEPRACGDTGGNWGSRDGG